MTPESVDVSGGKGQGVSVGVRGVLTCVWPDGREFPRGQPGAHTELRPACSRSLVKLVIVITTIVITVIISHGVLSVYLRSI